MDTKAVLAFIDRIVTNSPNIQQTSIQLAQLKRILQEQGAAKELINLVNPDDVPELKQYAGNMSVAAIKVAAEKARDRRMREAQYSRC